MEQTSVGFDPLKHRANTLQDRSIALGRLFMTPDIIKVVPSPAFSALKESAVFMRAHVAQGTMRWTDEIDLSPDTLYLRGLPA